ncbi:MAG TPA: DNA repair protein RecO [Candidatus Krumholzibacteria bacterium]|nr:DNA repair protein RecO [Candidatus Krumholzibacteria bacterium]
MLVKDHGIVLSVTRSGETSLGVVFLGRSSGKIRLLAKGALSPKHPSRGVLESGNQVEAVYYHKDGYSTFYLKEVSLVASPAAGRESLPHLAANLAALELLSQVCVSGASLDASIVDTAVAYLAAPPGADPLLLFLAFEIKLLDALGLAPDTYGCVHCGTPPEGGLYSPRDGVSFCAEHGTRVPEAVNLSQELVSTALKCAEAPFDVIAESGVSRAARKELGRLVHWTYTYHVQGYHLPRSLSLI